MMTRLSAILICCIFVSRSSFAQLKTVNMLDLKEKQYYSEILKLETDSVVKILLLVRFDDPGWHDEEHFYRLELLIKSRHIPKSKTIYNISMDTALVKSFFTAYPAWALPVNKVTKSGNFSIRQLPDSTTIVDLNLSFVNDSRNEQMIYRGTRIINSPSYENDIFLSSKGTWPMPVPSYKKVVKDSGSFEPGISFTCNKSSYVFALYDGEVVSCSQADSSHYTMVTRFGDYFIVYDQLKKPLFTKGNHIKQGMPIAIISNDGSPDSELSIFLIKNKLFLPVYEWLRWE